MKRAPSSDWPRLLTPAVGCYPPAAESWELERVLHIALRDNFEPQPALERALRSISSQYVQVDWQKEEREGHLFDALMLAASALKPTLVFAQVQRRNAIPGPLMAKVRDYCAPGVVIVQWDGDQHNEPEDEGRQWYVELGRECDCNLTCETGYQERHAALGVKRPGYLQIGIEERWYHPTDPTPGVPPVVLLGNNYPQFYKDPGGYRTRLMVAEKMEAEYGPEGFGLYGGGWEPDEKRGYKGNTCRKAPVRQWEESGIYAAAKAAISCSIRCDLPRYSSDRLFRMLASGAVCLVERFPDCEGLGLEDGVNCYLWCSWERLKPALDWCIDPVVGLSAKQAMREAAAALGLQHTWQARMPELAAIIQAVREARK